jgi:aminodeoxyfutalosine deaminase
VLDTVPLDSAGEGVQPMEGILCPGFINAHCHLELSHLRGKIPTGTGMVPFLKHVLFDRQAPEAIVEHAMHAACDEMSGNGIVAVGDICNTAASIPVKQLHGLAWHHFVEGSGFVPEGAARRFAQVAEVAAHFHSAFESRYVSITPHAPYSVSPVLLRAMASQHPAVMSIHHQESMAEDDFIRHGSGDMLDLYRALGIDIRFFQPTGNSSTHWLLPLLPPEQALLLVHHCTTEAADLDFLLHRFSDIHFVCCPNANLFISNPLPDLHVMVQRGVRLCVGTDSLASNWVLSILSELQTIQRLFGFPAATLLSWATMHGATALKLGERLGSFDAGKTPGVLLLEHTNGTDLQQATVMRLL